ncbi:DUF92 domain-containing protein [Halalkalibacter kiskunsagensis]|uniref:DUF92 domain-containing protein n=1 Tax=Halalkalibacter kiskunsagensis TaxID=1548599 RepID=A0ABV6KJM3_9BACI
MTIILLIGVFLLATIAYFKKKLTWSGAIAACFVGGFISIGFGLYGLLLLGMFFLSSTILGSLKDHNKESDIVEKGGHRDAIQVLANGGMASLLSLIYLIYPSPYLICGFVASLAAANSDTWASEIGPYSKYRPFHIIKRERVEVGTSGAITALGSSAAFAGSFLIVVLSIFFWWGDHYNSHILLIVLTLAGFIGNVVDTVLGAIWQVVYRCPSCSTETERKTHCSVKTVRVSGRGWVDNDIVNAGCTLIAALLGILIGWLFV